MKTKFINCAKNKREEMSGLWSIWREKHVQHIVLESGGLCRVAVETETKTLKLPL